MCVNWYNCGILCNGKLHWFMNDQNAKKDIILSFDLSEEKFEEISQPRDFKYEAFFHLGIIDECLCICVLRHPVWVMKNYNVRESWVSLQYAIDNDNDLVHYLRPIKNSLSHTSFFTNDDLIRSRALDVNCFFIFVRSLVSPHVNGKLKRKREADNTDKEIGLCADEGVAGFDEDDEFGAYDIPRSSARMAIGAVARLDAKGSIPMAAEVVFPQDIIEQILVRADVKALIGFKSVLCISTSHDEVIVANSLTRDVKKLPNPKKFDGLIWSTCWGFGYDSSTDDYKVIVGFKSISSSWMSFQVLSLKTNVWKDVGKLKYLCFSLNTIGILCNGKLHWFLDYQNEKGNAYAYAIILTVRVMKNYNVRESWVCLQYPLKNDNDVVHYLRPIKDSLSHTSFFTNDDMIKSRIRDVNYVPIFVRSLVSPHVNGKLKSKREAKSTDKAMAEKDAFLVDYVEGGLCVDNTDTGIVGICNSGSNKDKGNELWDSLESKYLAEDSSSKKFLVINFNNYKMVDSRPVMEQYNELLRILGQRPLLEYVKEKQGMYRRFKNMKPTSLSKLTSDCPPFP
ncbi:zinc finger, CCHC-type containing protein [Tanacetum coccineum]